MAFPVVPVVTGLFSLIGTGLKGLFKSKEKKAEVIAGGLVTALNAFKEHNLTERERLLAISTVISEANKKGGIASWWRPVSMLMFLGLIIAFWFGFAPPDIGKELPPALAEIFELVKIGIMGYMPLRTIDKAIESYNGRKILETITNKILDTLK